VHEYTARIAWRRDGAPFTGQDYSRGHTWSFDGGVEVRASASPLVVPLPRSVEDAVDPEEAFVAALSSCHMLWFLSLAADRGYVVESYVDDAVAVMKRVSRGKMAITDVTLRPVVAFAAGPVPDAAEHEAMHAEAHERCFISNSVTSRVRCEPAIAAAGAAGRE